MKDKVLAAVPTVIKLAFGLLIVKVVSFYMGAEIFGVTSQFIAYAGLLVVVCSGGLGQGLISILARTDKTRWSLVIFSSLAVCLIFCGMVFLLTALFKSEISIYLFGTEKYSGALLIGSMIFILMPAALVFTSIMVVEKSFSMLAVAYFLGLILAAVILIAAVLLNKPVLIFVSYGMFMVSAGIFGVLRLDFCRLKEGLMGVVAGYKEQIVLFMPYIAMQFITIFTLTFAQLDIKSITVETFGLESFGLLQGIYRLSDSMFQVVASSVTLVLLPILASSMSSKNSIGLLKSFSHKSMAIFALMGLVFYSMKDEFIGILLASEFTKYSNLFVLICIGDLFRLGSQIYNIYIVAKGEWMYFAVAELAQALLLLFSTNYAIVEYGLNGVVFAYVFSYVIYFAFSIFLTRLALRKEVFS